jgi:hypothetical protein
MPEKKKVTFGLRFLELLEDSVIVQSIVTVGVIGTMVYLSACGKEIDESLRSIGYTVIGFWFGSKVQHAEQRHIERLRRTENEHMRRLAEASKTSVSVGMQDHKS